MVKTFWGTFCVLASIYYIWSIHVEIEFCVFIGMGGVSWTHFENHFQSSQAREGFGQHILRHICELSRMHAGTCCVIAGMGGVWSVHIEIVCPRSHRRRILRWVFVPSLVCVGFRQKLWYILCPRWYGWVNTNLRYILSPRWNGVPMCSTYWDTF